MKPGPFNWLILLAALLAPFQLAGAAVYVVVGKKDRQRARRLGTVVPAATFFAAFLLIFLWGYLHPGMMFMVSGMLNLFVLILLAAGTLLNLAFSAALYAVLARRHPAEPTDRPSGS